MIKVDLWCSYCGTKYFTEHSGKGRYAKEHPEWYSTWECNNCGAEFQDNPGYGYFTTFWGKFPQTSDTPEKYSCCTGELLDETKQPRTPEGLVRSSISKEEMEKYLARTQIK